MKRSFDTKELTEINPIDTAKKSLTKTYAVNPIGMDNMQLAINDAEKFSEWLEDQDFWNDHDFQQLAELEAFSKSEGFEGFNDAQEQSQALLNIEMIKAFKTLTHLFSEEQKSQQAIPKTATRTNENAMSVIN